MAWAVSRNDREPAREGSCKGTGPRSPRGEERLEGKPGSPDVEAVDDVRIRVCIGVWEQGAEGGVGGVMAEGRVDGGGGPASLERTGLEGKGEASSLWQGA